MKTKIYNWLLKKVTPKYSNEEKDRINEFKSLFRIFFEGAYEYSQVYESYIPLSSFEITDLKFAFEGDLLHTAIVLKRCGLLIGKGGRTIDALNDYMNGFNIHIHIEESKLWNRLK